MKKKYFAALLAAALILLTTAFAAGNSDERIVRELVKTRTETLSSFYDGGMLKDEAREIISELETGDLKDLDLENIELYFQTDIDRINEAELISVVITEATEDLIRADVRMRWDVETVSGSDSFLCEYDVICVRDAVSYTHLTLPTIA